MKPNETKQKHKQKKTRKSSRKFDFRVYIFCACKWIIRFELMNETVYY